MVGQTWSGPVNPLWHKMVNTWTREQKIDAAVRRAFTRLKETNQTRHKRSGRAFHSVADFLQRRPSSCKYAGKINGMHIRLIRKEFSNV